MSEQHIALPGGETIIVSEDRRSTIFYIGDLFKYRFVDQSDTIIVGGGKYMPRVNDLVWHWQLGYFRVSAVDNTTYVANLSEWKVDNEEPEVTEEDKFLSSGSGYQSESWRIYLDTRTLPYRLEVDEGFRTYGNKSQYIKIFRGVDTSDSGEIVSAYYNQNGEYVSDSIPLEVVANVRDSVFSPLAEFQNQAIKAPSIGFTTKDIADGEYLTVVAYSQDGRQTRSARCIVKKTNVNRRVEDTQKRVVGIQLVSQWLSNSESNTLEIPLNIDVASVAMRARVNYSDGSSIEMDVGDEDSGQKFMIYGLKYWSPSVPGTPQNLSLVYRLSPAEEYSRMEGESENGLVRESYRIVATDIDPSMSLKIFAFPSWQQVSNAYSLEYWLFDLRRRSFFRVPNNLIELDASSRSFDGADFVSVQTLRIAVRLGELDSAWGNARHAQILQIGLIRSGGLRATNWRVRHSNNQSGWYGDNKEALVSVGNGATRIFDITCGFTSLEEWLDALYYSQEPLYDPLSETRAPAPSHFTLTVRNREYDYPISQWNTQLTVLSDLLEGQTAYIRFTNRSVNGEMQLGVVGLPIHNV